MGLVLDEGIREGEFLRRGCGNPGGNLLGRTQRVIDALVKIVADEVVRDAPIEDHNGIIVGEETGRRHDGGRNFFRAVEAENFFDEIDRTIKVVAPTRDTDGPRGTARGMRGGFFAGDGELECFEGRTHLGGRNVEAKFFGDVVVGDDDFTLPRDIAAHAECGADDVSTSGRDDQIDGAISGFMGAVNIDAAFVAIGRIGREPESLAGGADGLALEERALEDEVGGVGADAGIHAAHNAGDDQGLGGVRDDQHLGSEHALLAVERREFFSRDGATNDDLSAAKFTRVEGVQRLTGFEHHIVADVDDVIDRTEADGGEARLEPRGARANLNAGNNVCGVEWAVFRTVDADGGQEIAAQSRACRFVDRAAEDFLRVEERELEPRGEFTRDAEVREGVGAVGRDLDIEHGVSGREHIVDGGTERRAVRENEEAGGIFGDAEFLRGTHHAVGGLAADFRLLDFEISGQNCPGKCYGDAVADLVILRAANDGLHAERVAEVDRADGEFVGVRVFIADKDFADDDMGELGRAGADDLLHLEAEEGDRAGDLVVRSVEGDVVAEPVKRNFHGEKRKGMRIFF